MSSLQKKGIDFNYIFTGQHKETISEIQQNFKIKKPDYTLYSGKDITGSIQMIIWIIKCIFYSVKNKQQIFKKDKNGIVIVHGDTASTILGAIIGKLSGHKVAHVESGLRSFNLLQPFPEEIFRLLTFSLSDILFCPGESPLNNLKKYKAHKINTFNNTIYDSLSIFLSSSTNDNLIDQPGYKFGLVSLHRFENFKTAEHTKKILNLLHEISKRHKLLFILHKPTEKKLIQYGLLEELKINNNIEIRSRYPYFEFMQLVNASQFIITDGGSNQEECYYLGKPVLLFRNVTERKEGLNQNVMISQFNPDKISFFFNNLQKFNGKFVNIEKSPTEIIVKNLLKFI